MMTSINAERRIAITHLTTIRNMLVQRQESAHVQYVRAKETFPNLALHYEGQEVAFGVAIAMLDGTLRGIESVPVYDTGAGDAVEAYRG